MTYPLHIVTGKGGVGKTRYSLLLAREIESAQLSERGQQLILESQKIGLVCPPIYHISLQDLLAEFLMGVIKVQSLASFAAKSKLLQNIVRTAPNLEELLLLKKWKLISNKHPLVVDGPSTGNLIALVESIKTAQSMFDTGFLRHIADELDQAFLEPHRIHIHIVSLPENSALEEMKQIHQRVKDIYPDIKIHLILNRRHQKPDAHFDQDPELSRLAFERPELEAKRIATYDFDSVIFEGGTQLERAS